MIYHYFTQNYSHLFNSLERYFNSVPGFKLLPIEQTTLNKEDLNILVCFEEKDLPEFINIIKTKTPKSIITLGIDNKSAINLLNYDQLEIQLKNIPDNPKYLLKNLFTKEELFSKTKLFFKGHGEKSLLSSLSFAIYYLSNGPVLLHTDDCTLEEYQKAFLQPGLDNWKNFTERFEKYYFYLALLDFKKEIDEIKKQIKKFKIIAKKLETLNEKEIKKIDTSTLEKWFISLHKIDEVLISIQNSLGIKG
jgi:hypothetical protein